MTDTGAYTPNRMPRDVRSEAGLSREHTDPCPNEATTGRCQGCIDYDGGSDVAQTPVQSSDLLWFGDDSQWLAAEGHVDLAAFTAAAIAEAKALDYEVEDGLGSEPRHVWMRPAVRSDFETDEEFARAQEEDWHQWGGVTAETPGAVPWTIVDMEW